MPSLGIPKRGLRFDDLIARGCERPFETLTRGCLLRESSRELRLPLQGLLFRGESVGRCALLGVSKGGFNIGNLPFERLAGSSCLGNLGVSLLKLFSGGGHGGQL